MNSEKLRIIFMGTPDFAVGILDTLVKQNFNIVAVITAVDKPAGRGKKLRASSVKKYALEKAIPVLQPKNLKDELFIKELQTFNADLQVIVAFRMLPKVVWAMPKYGTINLHASLLPAYRGAAPINWAIINGEKETGVTSFFIDDKIDTGAILLQEKTIITPDETAGTLHDKLMYLGSQLVIKTINLIATESYKTIKQPENAPSLAPKIYKSTCNINWHDTIDHIYDKIRGLSPYPAAWSVLHNHNDTFTVKIYKTRKEHAVPNCAIGQIITTKKTMKVACSDGYLYLEEIQLSGKKRMDIVSLLNGFKLADAAYMESPE